MHDAELKAEIARLKQVIVAMGQDALSALDGRRGYYTTMQAIARRSAENVPVR